MNYSRIIAGTMTWGSWGKSFSIKETIATINHCLEQGITTFDHADIYGDYTNEADFGKAFADSGINREEIQLISKCGIQMITGRANALKHYDYSRDYIIWSAEESLKKLKTDYLDLFLLHRPSPLMHPEEIGEAIVRLKKAGKIKQFGVSNFTPSQITMLETVTPVSGNQVEFSLTQNKAMYDGTFDDCITNNRMAMAWSPLGSFYSKKSKRRKRIKKVFKRLEEKYSVESSQLLLAWILKHPAMVYPVVGTANLKRLSAAAQSLKIKLEKEDWFSLLAASQGHEVP